MLRKNSFGSRGIELGGVIIAAIIILALLALIGVGCASYSKTSTVTLHIIGKESVTTHDSSGNADHEYRVYAKEDTYVVKDSIVHPRFNSSNVYANLPIPVGAGNPSHAVAMRCEVYGYRIPLLSSFKNILKCSKIN